MRLFLRLMFAVALVSATCTLIACGDSDDGADGTSNSGTSNSGSSNNNSGSSNSAQVSCSEVVAHLESCEPGIGSDAEAACSGFSSACRGCIVDASCDELNSGTTCFSECDVNSSNNSGNNSGNNNGNNNGEIDGLLASCAAICTGDLTCVKKPDASSSDDGICTIQCGNDLDCTQLDGQAGVSAWTCEDVQGANKACVPFDW